MEVSRKYYVYVHLLNHIHNRGQEVEIRTAALTKLSSERPMLERAHLYSVDKQQVSIIQVGGERLPQESPFFRSRTASLTDRDQCPERPQRPSKTEEVHSNMEKENGESGHPSTLSEGNVISVHNDPSVNCAESIVSSPKPPMKPPRPGPPPPQPPPRRDSIESTDL